MSNLIPEHRVNKLGHTVIKHVRPDAAAKTGAGASIPRVSTLPTLPHIRLGETLTNSGLGVYRPGLNEKIAKIMSPEDAGRMTDFMKRPHGNLTASSMSRELTVAIENPKVGKALLKRIETHLDDMLALDPDDYPFSLMTGLQDYKKKYTREQEFALLRAANAASRLNDGIVPSNVPFPMQGYSLRDAKLRDLVASRPDRIDEIVEIITKHGISEGDPVAAILDSGLHSELQDGAL